MGSKYEYYIQEWKVAVDGWSVGADGKIKRNPVKLISVLIEDDDCVATSQCMDDVYKQVLKGEAPEWELREIEIYPVSGILILEYDPPAGIDKEFGCNIEFFIENIIEISFEIERGEGVLPDRYWLNGTNDRSWYLPISIGALYGRCINRAALVELIDGGTLCRISSLNRWIKYYTVTEERF